MCPKIQVYGKFCIFSGLSNFIIFYKMKWVNLGQVCDKIENPLRAQVGRVWGTMPQPSFGYMACKSNLYSIYCHAYPQPQLLFFQIVFHFNLYKFFEKKIIN